MGRRVAARAADDGERTTVGDTPLSFMPFMIKAASMALLRYPQLNARLSPDGRMAAAAAAAVVVVVMVVAAVVVR